MERLDFEQPIVELEEQLNKAIQLGKDNDADVTKIVSDIEKKLSKLRKETYENLTAWQRVQISRHPNRPYTLDYIEMLTKGEFIELHGDRTVKDDKAMIGGFGNIDGQSVMFIGQQKGKNTKLRQYRNFGMANPEGYRKALRLMKMAEKFNKPIVTLLIRQVPIQDWKLKSAVKEKQLQKFIRNVSTKSPVICIIIGEGASGGALGIGVGDKVHMLENTWYSVISPESCSSILWRSWNYKQQAAEALKLTSEDMFKNKLIDNIIKEPQGGAHYNPEEIYDRVKETIIRDIKSLTKIDPQKRIEKRIEKFCSMGVINE